jgi:hypothetical protein
MSETVKISLLPLAASLCCLGWRLVGLEWEENIAYFVFIGTNADKNQVKDSYFRNELRVSPLQFSYEQNKLRDLLFSEKRQMSDSHPHDGERVAAPAPAPERGPVQSAKITSDCRGTGATDTKNSTERG